MIEGLGQSSAGVAIMCDQDVLTGTFIASEANAATAAEKARPDQNKTRSRGKLTFCNNDMATKLVVVVADVKLPWRTCNTIIAKTNSAIQIKSLWQLKCAIICGIKDSLLIKWQDRLN